MPSLHARVLRSAEPDTFAAVDPVILAGTKTRSAFAVARGENPRAKLTPAKAPGEGQSIYSDRSLSAKCDIAPRITVPRASERADEKLQGWNPARSIGVIVTRWTAAGGGTATIFSHG